MKPWTLEEIQTLIQEGKTLQEIGDVFETSRQRILQICQKHGLPKPIKIRQDRKAETYRQKWGNREDSEFYRTLRSKFSAKKANAKVDGIEWNLHFGDLEWPTECPVLGIPIDYFSDGRTENSPSFDRLDPSKGYVHGNVKVISWRANRIKNDGNAEEHRLIASYMTRFSD
jgi:hypothetical protein